MLFIFAMITGVQTVAKNCYLGFMVPSWVSRVS